MFHSIGHLRNRQCLEHEGSVRDAQGAAESISSYLSALPTIQVHLELDGRTLDIVLCFYNIVWLFQAKKSKFHRLRLQLNHFYEPFLFQKILANQSAR